MKRLILLLGLIFLNSCTSSSAFQDSGGCPVPEEKGTLYLIDYEYGSAQMNADARRRVREIALKAKAQGDYVCFLGEVIYRGRPEFKAQAALARTQNAAAVFLEVGVPAKKIYIGTQPQAGEFGFSAPLKAADEKHRLKVLTGKKENAF